MLFFCCCASGAVRLRGMIHMLLLRGVSELIARCILFWMKEEVRIKMFRETFRVERRESSPASRNSWRVRRRGTLGCAIGILSFSLSPPSACISRLLACCPSLVTGKELMVAHFKEPLTPPLLIMPSPNVSYAFIFGGGK